jgi:uncharacterized protein (DUF2236 family)
MNLFLKALGGEAIAGAFRRTVSGDVSGVPQWALQMGEGDDVGFFGVDSDVWKVHGSLATLVGGVRALLMQAAYPAALAGVSQHSSYDTDPLGRLERTTRWLTITSFASTEVIEREAQRVRAMHSRVNGSYQDNSGTRHQYSAEEERHLLWVHCAFTDSFITAYRLLDRAPERTAPHYVSEWARSAQPLGLRAAPKSDQELALVLEDFFENQIGSIDLTSDVVRFIIHPPFSKLALPFYRTICNAAISTLDPRVIKVLGIKKRSRRWINAAIPMLRALQLLLGEESPSQSIARERIRRISSPHERNSE